ncbi:MAG TPA: hypothetical protein VM120_07485 [Bryobacteraceae bacterium]|nr:hypothetical protein [Bryobacteraceae bacterium]
MKKQAKPTPAPAADQPKETLPAARLSDAVDWVEAVRMANISYVSNELEDATTPLLWMLREAFLHMKTLKGSAAGEDEIERFKNAFSTVVSELRIDPGNFILYVHSPNRGELSNTGEIAS